ncbi:MAG: TonB-dependent receptor [Thiobacillus sp.]|nr:TonB-dependent receptor [Thiobacillus sp.]
MNNKPQTTLGVLGWALLLNGALTSPAQALAEVSETDFFDDLPVVLSASRLSQPVNEAPAAVTVIDQDMIRASGFRDIPDLFRLVPGFTVAYTRDNTWGVGYHGLADAFSRRMQVLIDGRSVYTASFGEVPWASLPLSIEDIERIEVVRGPNSASYGSNAFFGIINIITKDAAQVPGSHLSVQAGDQGMGGTMFRYGDGKDDLRYRLTLSGQRRDRFDTRAEQTTTRHLDLRVDYRLSATDEITTTFALSRGDWRHGVVGESGDPVRRMDVGTEHFQAKFRRVIDPENEWFVQFYHTRLRNEDGFVVTGLAPIDMSYTQWREDIEFQMISSPSDQLRLVWGAEARWDGVKSPGYFYNQDARTGALYRLFGNAEWRLSPKWIVNAGALAEHHYLSGFDVSPRLAVNFLPHADHAFRASITQAYRSPTFFEEGGDQRIFTASGSLYRQYFEPSAGLQPERILSREIGYIGHVHPLRLQIDARLFNDKVSRLVGTYDDPLIPGKLFHFFNESRADINGADIQLRWALQNWLDLVLSYARVDIDSNDGDIAGSVPKNNFSALGILKLADGWQANVGAYRVGAMYWLGDGDVTKAFTRIDARLARRWKLQGNPVELALVGQNLGGERYEEFRDENLFDRRAYLSLMFDW